MSVDEVALNPKQQRFVDEYLIDLNATQAAIRAGYSENGAGVQGKRLLMNAKIQAAIAEAQRDLRNRVLVKQEDVVREWMALGFSDAWHYRMAEGGGLELVEGAPANATRAVSSVKHKRRVILKKGGGEVLEHEVEFRLWDKNTALANMAKHLGMFVERTSNYNFNPADFSREGLRRVAEGEDPQHVLASGGAKKDT